MNGPMHQMMQSSAWLDLCETTQTCEPPQITATFPEVSGSREIICALADTVSIQYTFCPGLTFYSNTRSFDDSQR